MSRMEHLLKHFTPENYQLELDLERLARRFNGRVVISGTRSSVHAPIKLHAKDLTITGALVNNLPATVELGDNDELSLTPGAQPTTTKLTLTLEFNGKITDAMNGLYPCYFEHDGKKMELLATQLESHHAREIFPCIDEPSAKATFDVALQTEKDVTVLGNMPVKNQQILGERRLTTFETTPRMSTYLLAFVVGDLHHVSTTTKDNVAVNVWASRAQPAQDLAFALDTAMRAIEFFDDYFGAKYPLPKADLVAIPDFSGGVAAMENWGLMTFREDYMLVDPKTTSVSTKQAAATSIVHEVSHQWFGNLVTMKWWDDLWLNESFATLMEYISLDALFPNWNVWLDFAIHDRMPALRRDSVDGVQAIKTDVNHPDEINTLFDGAIVYAKGGCIIHMLRAYIGEAAFKKGLKQYFVEYAYANTSGADLWRVLGEAAGVDVVSFITPWLEQSGYPVVSLKNTDKQLVISQSRFVICKKPTDKKLWPIPLFASTPALPHLLETQTKTIKLDNTTNIKLNMGDRAHFITTYSPDLLKQLMKGISSGKLAPVDRLQLLSDATLLPKAGLSPTAELIPLLAAYKNETSQPIWDIITLTIGDLKRFVETDEHAEAGLKRLATTLGHNLYHKLGWIAAKNESDVTTKLRATIISPTLYGEDPAAIKKALELYRRASDISHIPGELRSLVLGAAVKHSGDPAVINDLLAYHATTHSSDLRQDISHGLAATRDPAVAARLLNLFTDADTIRPQDIPHWFASMLRNRFSRQLTWEWMASHWHWIQQTFDGGTSYDLFPRYGAAYLNQPDDLAKYQHFFEPLKNEPALTRAIDVGITEISGRLAWLKRDRASVTKKLLK